MKITSRSLKDTEKIAEDFVKKLSFHTPDGALVVGLYGDLGSGKTTFTQDVARIFGILENITSPTYVIEKIYPIIHAKFKNLIHIDAYRLNSGKELISLGWKNISSNPDNIILIEWPEKVAEILPENHIKINFKFISDTEREIEI